MDYLPYERWQKIWNAKLGHWECKNVYLIGSELDTFPTMSMTSVEVAALANG